MKLKQKDQQVTDSQSGKQNKKEQSDKNNEQKTVAPTKQTPGADDEKETTDRQREYQDKDHPHDFTTPRADKTQGSNKGNNQHKKPRVNTGSQQNR